MGLIFLLLILFQIKHFMADYILQTPYMLQKFKGGREWILPLAAHAGVHALYTTSIAALVTSNPLFAVSCGFFDFAVHFTMDRIKASPNMLGKYKNIGPAEWAKVQEEAKGWSRNEYSQDSYIYPCGVREEARKRIKHNTYFWYSLGLDQLVHHCTHYIIIAAIVYVYTGGIH